MDNSGGIQASLAGRYATALFGLARDEQQIDAVTRSLDTLEAAMNESADFKTLVSSPLVNRTEAGKAVRALTPTLGVDPITMLTAGDVMQEGASANGGVTATATPATPLVDILDAMSRTPGNVGVVDNGTVVGTINAQDIVNGLTRHRRRG